MPLCDARANKRPELLEQQKTAPTKTSRCHTPGIVKLSRIFLLASALKREKRNKLLKGLPLGTIFAVAMLAAGCANDHPSTRILFNHASINDMPARLALDTGSANMIIFDGSAKRAGMQISGGIRQRWTGAAKR